MQPTFVSRVLALNEIFVTLMTFLVTVTVKVADLLLPSFAFAVITAVPVATPVTSPVVLTFAIPVLLLLHVTLVSLALDGDTFAVNCKVSPAFTVLLPFADVILTPVTGCFTVTSTLFSSNGVVADADA